MGSEPRTQVSHSSSPHDLRTQQETTHLSLSTGAPHILHESIALSETVQAVVALAHGSYKSAESIDLVLASVAAVLVDLANTNLNGSVVLGLDDAVGRAAFAGDVANSIKRHLVSARNRTEIDFRIVNDGEAGNGVDFDTCFLAGKRW